MQKWWAIILLTLSGLALANTDRQQRIFLLENMLAPTTAKNAADMWAKAAMQRNGAVQFMLLCPAQKLINQNTLINLNWLTGASSPSIVSYKIVALNHFTKSYDFTILYTLQLAGNTYILKDKLQITTAPTDSSQRWCINQFTWLSPAFAKPS
jgi:hypothetical protein